MKCKIPPCKSTHTKACARCAKPVCIHHCSGWGADVPTCAKCRTERERNPCGHVGWRMVDGRPVCVDCRTELGRLTEAME